MFTLESNLKQRQKMPETNARQFDQVVDLGFTGNPWPVMNGNFLEREAV